MEERELIINKFKGVNPDKFKKTTIHSELFYDGLDKYLALLCVMIDHLKIKEIRIKAKTTDPLVISKIKSAFLDYTEIKKMTLIHDADVSLLNYINELDRSLFEKLGFVRSDEDNKKVVITHIKYSVTETLMDSSKSAPGDKNNPKGELESDVVYKNYITIINSGTSDIYFPYYTGFTNHSNDVLKNNERMVADFLMESDANIGKIVSRVSKSLTENPQSSGPRLDDVILDCINSRLRNVERHLDKTKLDNNISWKSGRTLFQLMILRKLPQFVKFDTWIGFVNDFMNYSLMSNSSSFSIPKSVVAKLISNEFKKVKKIQDKRRQKMNQYENDDDNGNSQYSQSSDVSEEEGEDSEFVEYYKEALNMYEYLNKHGGEDYKERRTSTSLSSLLYSHVINIIQGTLSSSAFINSMNDYVGEKVKEEKDGLDDEVIESLKDRLCYIIKDKTGGNITETITSMNNEIMRLCKEKLAEVTTNFFIENGLEQMFINTPTDILEGISISYSSKIQQISKRVLNKLSLPNEISIINKKTSEVRRILNDIEKKLQVEIEDDFGGVLIAPLQVNAVTENSIFNRTLRTVSEVNTSSLLTVKSYDTPAIMFTGENATRDLAAPSHSNVNYMCRLREIIFSTGCELIKRISEKDTSFYFKMGECRTTQISPFDSFITRNDNFNIPASRDTSKTYSVLNLILNMSNNNFKIKIKNPGNEEMIHELEPWNLVLFADNVEVAHVPTAQSTQGFFIFQTTIQTCYLPDRSVVTPNEKALEESIKKQREFPYNANRVFLYNRKYEEPPANTVLLSNTYKFPDKKTTTESRTGVLFKIQKTRDSESKNGYILINYNSTNNTDSINSTNLFEDDRKLNFFLSLVNNFEDEDEDFKKPSTVVVGEIKPKNAYGVSHEITHVYNPEEDIIINNNTMGLNNWVNSMYNDNILIQLQNRSIDTTISQLKKNESYAKPSEQFKVFQWQNL